jgi:hypothetical protein
MGHAHHSGAHLSSKLHGRHKQARLGKRSTPYQKKARQQQQNPKTKAKRAGAWLKHEALSSNCSSTKTKTNKTNTITF